jgi:alpha-beta hydrolase superfamily lysophospholipase
LPGDASTGSKNILVCIHGAYCDGQVFAYIANQISHRGFRVYALDLPGHGRSDGSRGDTQFDECLVSLSEVIQTLKNRTKNQVITVGEGNQTNFNLKIDNNTNIRENSRIFVLGHSLGCTFALWYARRFKSTVDGIILMAPYLRIPMIKKRSEVEPSLLNFLYLVLRRQLTPTRIMKFVDVIPKLKKIGGEEIALLLKHKENNFRYTLRFIVDIVGLRNDKIREILNINLPTLILHGRQDRLVYSEVSQKLFNMIDSPRKEIKLFDCDHWFYHSIFYQELIQSLSYRYSDSDRNMIIQEIVNWMNQVS